MNSTSIQSRRHSPLRLVALGWLLVLLMPVQAWCQYKVVHLPHPYNTPGSETAALQVGDTVLVYASMPPSTSTGGAFGVKHTTTHLYQARIAPTGKLSRPRHDRWGFCSEKDHTGNVALDPVSRDAYFTRANVETLRSEIWYAKAKKRRGWEKPVRLQGPVNSRDHTATHPAIGRAADGSTVLFFVSDRDGGLGGMDIWQCSVADGTASEPVNMGPQVNSAADEYTPFYDQRNGVLYFSSNRDGGMGGFDIYCATGQGHSWQAAEPVCGCLNSEQNDLYFTIAVHDSATGMPVVGYLSSNRKDSFFMNDSMCCNDIYRWSIDTAALLARQKAIEDSIRLASIKPPAPEKSPVDRFFPLYLYFHNDEPDPRSLDSTTATDYADCQLRYALMRSEYMAHQPSTTDSALMKQFFDSCVVGNFERLTELLVYVQEQIAAGHGVRLTISGHASPVYTDEYNQVLSQRRIGSFLNLLHNWRGGTLAQALADGRLRIVQRPQGADRSLVESRPTGSAIGHPIYGLAAARARRIVILACEKF